MILGGGNRRRLEEAEKINRMFGDGGRRRLGRRP